MYYNKIAGRLVLDFVDYFLLSIFVSSNLTSYLKNNYFSEKASMARLEADIIKKSNLIEPSTATKSLNNLNFKESKMEKIYKIALQSRGGADAFQTAQKIKALVEQLSAFLKERELKALKGTLLKFLFTNCRLVLQLMLSLCKINLHFIITEGVNPQVMVVALTTGGALGAICAWFSVAAMVVAPTTLVSIFFSRSLFQQINHNVEYQKLQDNLDTFNKERKTMYIKNPKNVQNSKTITIPSLNWNKNPNIQETAERLGIFENEIIATEPITLDYSELDHELKKIFKKIGWNETPNIQTRIKGKTVNFRDFVNGMADGNINPDLDVIDAEIIKEPIQIIIKD